MRKEKRLRKKDTRKGEVNRSEENTKGKKEEKLTEEIKDIKEEREVEKKPRE